MIENTIIINNLIEELNIKNESELAKKLEISRQALQNHKNRNTVPYKNIINYCIINKIDLNKIFNNKINVNNMNIQKNRGDKNIIVGNNSNVSSNQNNDKHKSILQNLNKLPKKRQEYYYYKIGLEVIEQEEEK